MTQIAPNRLVVFDCDGTLVDSQHAIVEAMKTAFRHNALTEPPAEATRRTVGLPLSDAVRRLLPAGAQDKLGDVVENYKEAAYILRQQSEHEEPLYPGVTQVLDSLLSKGYQLGVATGKSSRGLEATLKHHRLHDHFNILKTAEDGPGKPNPDILWDAMAEIGAAPETTIMIGDTTFDIVMAVRARVPAIGVAWGYHAPEELVAAGAVHIAVAFTELPSIICGLWKRTS